MRYIFVILLILSLGACNPPPPNCGARPDIPKCREMRLKEIKTASAIRIKEERARVALKFREGVVDAFLNTLHMIIFALIIIMILLARVLHLGLQK